ncbi:MAG: efflux RND transporter periplasmic adaptor subunit [Gammaproteobacteria bacterium]
MKTKIVVPVVILAVAFLGAVTLLVTSQRLRPTQPDPVATAVRVLEIHPGIVRMTVHTQGAVAPLTETDLVPEVSGTVVWVSPNLVSGGYFEKGDPLLRVDDRDYRNSVDRAEASISRAEAEDQLAQFNLARSIELESQELISQADLENATRNARVAKAALRDARVVLEQTERDLMRTEIRGPFTGLVRSERVDVGQFVSRGVSVASVYGSDYVEVRLPIADKQLAYLSVPLTQRGVLDGADAPLVTLSASFAGTKQQWLGRIVRTEAEIDAASRMVHAVARIRAGEDGNNMPPPIGLFVQAEIEGRSVDNVVVLPRSALRNDSQVLIVDDDSRLQYRSVKVLRAYRDEVYIVDGLSKGEVVCISPLQTVVSGMLVSPIYADRGGDQIS